jgi:hypothetical protein
MTARRFPVRDRIGATRDVDRYRSGRLGLGLLALALGGVLLVATGAPPSRRATGEGNARPEVARLPEQVRGRTPAVPARGPIAKARTPPVVRGEPDAPIERLIELEQTREQLETLWDAEQAGIAACMKQRGFDYQALPYDDGGDVEEQPRIEPWDIAAARTVGYGLVQSLARAAQPERADPVGGGAPASGARVSPGYREALMGPDLPPGVVPSTPEWESVELPGGARVSWYRDSCFARARDAVYREDYPAVALGSTTLQLHTDIEAELASDAEYRAALDDWRRCMADQGYMFAGPRQAVGVLADGAREGRLTMDELRKAEIATAIADATCYRSAGLIELSAAARERAERAVLARAQDSARGLRHALDQAVARAGALLITSGTGTGDGG